MLSLFTLLFFIFLIGCLFGVDFKILNNERPKLVDFLNEALIDFYVILNFFAGMYHRRMIPSPQLFPNRWVTYPHILAQKIHNDLARLHHFFFARLLIYRMLIDIIKAGNDADNVFC